MINLDWTGNKKTTFVTIGASNHTDAEREQRDYYATDPKAASLLMECEQLHDIWEVSCGEGHLAKEFEKAGLLKRASDIVVRNWPCEQLDFLEYNGTLDGDIVTNPPYKFAEEFVKHALDVVNDGRKVCMFLKLTFLEGKSRKELFDTTPPARIYVSSSRIICAKNADFKSIKTGAVAYAWYVWEKGLLATLLLSGLIKKVDNNERLLRRI